MYIIHYIYLLYIYTCSIQFGTLDFQVDGLEGGPDLLSQKDPFEFGPCRGEPGIPGFFLWARSKALGSL